MNRPEVLNQQTAARGTPLRREQDGAMIEHPAEWPAWPMLPLKRNSQDEGSWPEIGVMLAVKEWLETPTVFLAPMYGLGKGTFAEVVKGIERKEYLDVDGLLDDGWTVD